MSAARAGRLPTLIRSDPPRTQMDCAESYRFRGSRLETVRFGSVRFGCLSRISRMKAGLTIPMKKAALCVTLPGVVALTFFADCAFAPSPQEIGLSSDDGGSVDEAPATASADLGPRSGGGAFSNGTSPSGIGGSANVGPSRSADAGSDGSDGTSGSSSCTTSADCIASSACTLMQTGYRCCCVSANCISWSTACPMPSSGGARNSGGNSSGSSSGGGLGGLGGLFGGRGLGTIGFGAFDGGGFNRDAGRLSRDSGSSNFDGGEDAFRSAEGDSGLGLDREGGRN
jgi:hypothetical protein